MANWCGLILKEHVVHPLVLRLCIVQQIKLCTHICVSLGQNVHMYAFTDFSVPCNIYVYLCHSMCLQQMEFSKFSALLPLAGPQHLWSAQKWIILQETTKSSHTGVNGLHCGYAVGPYLQCCQRSYLYLYYDVWPHYCTCSVVVGCALIGNVTHTLYQSRADSLQNEYPRQAQATSPGSW